MKFLPILFAIIAAVSAFPQHAIQQQVGAVPAAPTFFFTSPVASPTVFALTPPALPHQAAAAPAAAAPAASAAGAASASGAAASVAATGGAAASAVAAPSAVVSQPTNPVFTTTHFQAQDGFGKFQFGFANTDGQVKAELGNPDVVSGKYSYVSPEGQDVHLSYVADKNGFQAAGSHLPTNPSVAPLLPADLARAYTESNLRLAEAYREAEIRLAAANQKAAHNALHQAIAGASAAAAAGEKAAVAPAAEAVAPAPAEVSNSVASAAPQNANSGLVLPLGFQGIPISILQPFGNQQLIGG